MVFTTSFLPEEVQNCMIQIKIQIHTNRKINTHHSPPPAQEDCGGVDRRGRMSATVRSSGDQLETVLLAGASGEQGTGAGEEGESGGLQAELEGLEADSDRRESSRRRRESGGGREVPTVAPSASSRPQQYRGWPAKFVRLQRRLSGARGGWGWLRASFRCFPDVRTRAPKLGQRFGAFWVQQSDWRWGGSVAARLVGWNLPGGCWRSGK